MAEPVPPSVQSPNAASGSPPMESSPSLPTNADDRAAAAALSSLNTAQIENDAEDADSTPAAGMGTGKGGGPSKADKEALGKAMSRLEMIAGGGGGGGGTGAGIVKRGTEAGKKEAASSSSAKAMGKGKSTEVNKKPVVKVVSEDVNLLVDQLDLTKVKAMDLLKAHEGNPGKAIRAFIAPAV